MKKLRRMKSILAAVMAVCLLCVTFPVSFAADAAIELHVREAAAPETLLVTIRALNFADLTNFDLTFSAGEGVTLQKITPPALHAVKSYYSYDFNPENGKFNGFFRNTPAIDAAEIGEDFAPDDFILGTLTVQTEGENDAAALTLRGIVNGAQKVLVDLTVPLKAEAETTAAPTQETTAAPTQAETTGQGEPTTGPAGPTEATTEETTQPADLYTVTFDANGGKDAPAALECKKGERVTLGAALPKNSYTITFKDSETGSGLVKTVACTFLSWNTKADGSGDAYAPGDPLTPTASLTLYAQWGAPAVGWLTTPRRTGFLFDGWYLESDAAPEGRKLSADDLLTGDVTAVAHWTPVLMGDVDNDGIVTAADARLALRAAVGLEDYEETSAAFFVADADADGALTAADARVILRVAVGLETLD